MARWGAHVVVTNVSGEAAERVAAECGGSASAHRLDARDGEAVRTLIERVTRERGRLDHLFNNAGIGVAGEVHEITKEHWERILDVDVRGVIHGVMAAYPIMNAAWAQAASVLQEVYLSTNGVGGHSPRQGSA